MIPMIGDLEIGAQMIRLMFAIVIFIQIMVFMIMDSRLSKQADDIQEQQQLINELSDQIVDLNNNAKAALEEMREADQNIEDLSKFIGKLRAQIEDGPL